MIYLLRHGQTEPQKQKSFIGQTDIPLSEKGICQALLWREKLKAVRFERIFCSDLERTRRTARIIARHRAEIIRPMPLLREIHLGEWEMRPMSEIQRHFPREWHCRGENIVSYRPPDGENFEDLHDRVIPFFEKIAGQSEGNILIAAHAGVNRVILCHALGMPLTNLFRITQDYAGLNMMDYNKKNFRVIAVNISPAGMNL